MNSIEVQEIIRDHYLNPKNYGIPEWSADSVVTIENPTCGDTLTLYMQLDGDIVTNVSFVTSGCSILVASASLLYSEIIGKSINDENFFSERQIFEILGFIPTPSRQNCALLSLGAIKQLRK